MTGRILTIAKQLAAITMLGALLATALTTSTHAAQPAQSAQSAQTAQELVTYINTTTLTTPPLVPNGNTQMDCYIINVGKKPRFVTIDVRTRTGDVVASWNGVLNPDEEAVAIAQAAALPRSCRFIVEGQAKDFRASGLVVLPGTGSISALAAQ
jgi:hypothetical protein